MRWLRRLRPDRASRRMPIAEPMEPRLLYSADVTAGLMLATSTAEAAPEVRTLTASGEYASAASATATATATATTTATAANAYASASLTFEANQGQAPAGVDYVAQGSGYGIALSGGNAQLTLAGAQGVQSVTLTLQGANAAAAQGEDLQAAKSNYILGSDASQWQTGIANYGAVRYANVYDGVDVRYYGTQRQLEYDFIVAAGADAGAIRLQFQGAGSVAVDADGNLVLQVAGSDSTVRFQAPVAYQRGADGQLQAVASRYEVHADGTVGFVLGDYDHARELVIDPVLDYATYFGDSGNETAYAVTTDAAGNVYVTGRTSAVSASTGPLAPVIGAGGGSGDIFVAKFNADLSQLLWSTRIGGSGDDQGNAIAVDANGNVAVTGWTKSSNFPTQNASQSSINGGQDAVILKLDASGGLVFSTYLGGTGATDSGNAVAFDGAGNVYAAGQESDTGLLSAVLQLLFGTSDNAFVNKYDATGTLTWSQLLGGSSTDLATGIAVDASGNAYVVGNTQSSNMSTTGGQQTSLSGSIDGFLVRLDASGNTTYSTYVGGSDADTTKGVAIDATGKAYVVGVTRARASVVFTTTTGAFMTSSPANNKDTGFLRIYDTTQAGAASLVYSSYLGGSGSDLPAGVAYANGRVVVVGLAGSTDFPLTADALQATNPGSAMFVAILDPSGNGNADLQYGTYYGANMTPGGLAIHGNKVVIAGGSSATGYSTGGAYQPVKSGGTDAFVVVLGDLANTAPVLAGVVQPPAILEDSGAGSGFSVASLLSGQVTDPDSAAVQGIAIVASDNTYGAWQYSLDNGSTWTAVGATSAGSALLLAADSQTRLRFVPNANYNGTATLTVRAWDRTSGTAATRVNISSTGGTTAYSTASFPVNQQVTPVNDAPVVSGPVTLPPIPEDGSATITRAQLLASATDVDVGDTLSVTNLVASAGSLVDNGNGTWTFTPGANYNGNVAFTYGVSDGTVTVAGSASLAVSAVNDAPTTSAVSLPAVAEDSGPVTITRAQLLANAADVDGDALSVVGLAATGGSLVDNGNGTWTFTAGANYNGTVGFTYGVSDGSVTVAGTASLVVTPVNDPPTASAVTLPAMAEDGGTVTITNTQLLANAGDVDGDILSVTGLVANSGTLVDNGNGTWSFTPAANFHGTVGFTYAVSDGTATVAGSASLVVTPVNDAPTTSAVTLPAVAEDSGPVTITQAQLLANASDVDAGDTLSVTNLVASAGSLVDNGNGTWTFTPGANYNGTVGFTYGVSDGTVTVAGTASLAVAPVNDAPTTSAVTLPAAAEDSGPVTITQAQLLANASDVDTGDTLSVTNLVASTGALVDNGNGTWTFTPGANYNGTVAFSYGVSDGTATVAGTASLVVTPSNDAPATAPVSLPPMSEDGGTVTITAAQLLANASDVDVGDTLSVTNLVASTGSLVDNGNGTWSFTPGTNYNGTVAFSYGVSDGTATTPGSASLAVSPVNDAPTTTPVTLAGMQEDGATVTISAAQLLANAGDIDGDPLSVTNLLANGGTLVDNGNGTWSFTPAPDFNGPVAFTYGVTDGTASAAGTASLQVAPVNDAPTTSTVVLPAMAEDGGPVTVTSAQLLGNAADVDGDTLSVQNLAANGGTLADNGNGTWTFTPGANFNGTVAFSYAISDGTATTAGTASLAVTAVNDAPANPGAVGLPAIAEDSGSVTITQAQLLANASDVDVGDTLSVANLAANAGTLVDNGNGTWTFTPAANFNGTVAFTYAVSDGTASVAGSASLAVTPVNDAPTASPVGLPAMAEDGGTITITQSQLLANAADVDGDALSVTALAADSGTLVDNGNGTWSFTPAANFNGSVAFTYGVTDGTATVAGSAALSVTPVNDAPTTAAVSLPSVAEDSGPVTITRAQLLANATDVDGDTLSVLGLSASAGALADNGNGTWTFTPAANFNGTVTFTYTVSDGSATVAGTASLAVTPVNDVPATSNVVLPGMPEDGGTVTITTAQLLANATDADGDALSLANVAADAGTLVDNGNGTWTFSPAANWNGTVHVSYTIADGSATTAGSATLAVAPVNDAPTNSAVTLPAMQEDGTITITAAQLLAQAADVDGDALAVLNLTAGSGTLVANGNGTWSFTPAANFNGPVAFAYDVTDGVVTVAGTAALQVDAVNDAPATTAVNLPGMAEDGGSVTITSAQLLANASDVEGDALSVRNLAADSGTLVDNGNGTWTFTPARDFNGVVTFSYVVSDGSGGAPGRASLAVSPVDDAPVVTSDGGQPTAGVVVAENTLAVTTVTASDVDTPAQGLVFSISGGADAALFAIDPARGTLSFLRAPDFESPADANRDNVYDVVVQVSDGTAAARQALAVRVANVDETGTVIAAPAPAPAPPVAPAPAPASPPVAAVPPAAAPASAPAAAQPGDTRGNRAAESLQEALGPSMPTAIAAFNSTEVSFTSAPARIVLEADTSRFFRTVVFDRGGLQLIAAQTDDPLVQARFGIDGRIDGGALDDVQRTLRSAAFSGQLDRLRESVREELDLDRSVQISVVSVSLGLSLVYVLWLIRGGVLLGSYLSALPAWRMLDPLPVLSRVGDEEDDEEPLEGGRRDGRDTLRGFG